MKKYLTGNFSLFFSTNELCNYFNTLLSMGKKAGSSLEKVLTWAVPPRSHVFLCVTGISNCNIKYKHTHS